MVASWGEHFFFTLFIRTYYSQLYGLKKLASILACIPEGIQGSVYFVML